jgi:competence protein ComEA
VTPAERKALLFLAAVGVLGGAARLMAGRDDALRARPSVAEQAALDAQLAAVDSARAAGGGARRPRRRASERPPRPARREADDAPAGRRRVTAAPRPRRPRAPAAPPPTFPIDVDVADSAALDALPGIGPSLARRIVADRVTHGTFGSLEALGRVRGVGPKLLARVSASVTFSGIARPTHAGERPRAPP